MHKKVCQIKIYPIFRYVQLDVAIIDRAFDCLDGATATVVSLYGTTSKKTDQLSLDKMGCWDNRSSFIR